MQIHIKGFLYPTGIISLFLLLFFLSCTGGKVKNNTEPEDSADIKNEAGVPPSFDASTSLILLPRNTYHTYRDHFAYISDEEYSETNLSDASHLNDTLSIGLSNDEGALGLADSLRLGMDWLCILLPEIHSEQSPITYKAKTVGYSFNEVIGSLPLTLLSVQDNKEKAIICDIAFRGNYKESQFNLLKKKKLTATELEQAIQEIRRTTRDKEAVPPRPMSSDTLLLNNIYKITDHVTVAKYLTREYNDSDSDLGNEAVFVLQDNKLDQWFAGMSCHYSVFELKGEKYLYVIESAYASSKVTLLKLTGKTEVIYSNLMFAD